MSLLQRVIRLPKKSFDLVKNAAVIDKRRLYATWEHIQLTKLLAYLDVDCVFDIGASQGEYAEMLRKKAGYKGYILSFEPNPYDAHIARKRAQGDDKWMVSELAISESDGDAQFNVMRASQFSSLSTPKNDDVELFRHVNSIAEIITVKTERLETTLRRLRAGYGFKRPFLKMDTQGFDVKIVQASAHIMRDFVGMQSELAIAKLYATSVDFREAITEYERCGFSLSAFVPNNSGHFPCLLEIDCVMIRSDLAPSWLALGNAPESSTFPVFDPTHVWWTS
ncbi:FkbM family methyltransferase [Paraburkholderia sediminicola]|uniref:FkbM family methyltransferase n=1 Tax=Paraburkholderia sediminicola TaxID=458836 RepID=UPI0038BDF855